MDAVYIIIRAFMVIAGLGAAAVGAMIGFSLIVYSIGAAHHFLTAPADIRRKFQNDWSGTKEGKSDHFEQGRILIVSTRGVLVASIPGLINSLLIIGYIASRPHSPLDMQAFLAGVISSLVSLGVVGYGIGVYFGATGKTQDTKKRK